MKKYIASMLALLLLALLPVSAFAVEGPYTEGTLYYTVSDGSITITGCFGKSSSVTVPASIAGYPVNTIAKGAFSENKYVKEVSLPDTITSIEEGAFAAGITVYYGSASQEETKDTKDSGTSGTTDKTTTGETSEKTDTGKTGDTAESTDHKKTGDTAETADTTGKNTTGEIISGGNTSETTASGSIETEAAGFDEADVFLEEEETQAAEQESAQAEPQEEPEQEEEEEPAEAESETAAATGEAGDTAAQVTVKKLSPIPYILAALALIAIVAAVLVALGKKKKK